MLVSVPMTRTFAPTSEFFQTTDAGAGGGAGGGQMPAGGGNNGGGTGGGGQAGAGGGGGGGAQPIPLTADSMVLLPGQSQPVKWGDHSQSYIPKSELATHQQAAVASFLKQLVAAKQKQNQNPNANRGQQPGGRTERVDPFADMRDLPLVDGKSLTSALERMQTEGIGPLYEWAAKANQVIDALSKKISLTEKATGSLAEERSATEFQGKMKAAAMQVAKDMLPGINLADHPVVEEFVQDVYLSYDPRDPKLEQEFGSLLKSRLDGLFKLANALNQSKLRTAREQRRLFLKPGGQPKQANGQPAERLTHKQIARNLFSNDASAT